MAGTFKLIGEEPGLPPQPEISEAVFCRLRSDGRARRVCFQTRHANALKRTPTKRYLGTFKVPFEKSIGPIFEKVTGLKLEESQFGGFWHKVQTEADFNAISKWISAQDTRVFLRDCLALSIALSEHFDDQNQRTQLGQLENQAKYRPRSSAGREAQQALGERVTKSISELPFYKDAPFVSAVPPRPGKTFDLPTYIANSVAISLGLNDISDRLSRKNGKEELKEMPIEEKWAALGNAGLVCDFEPETLSPVILIDDLYQSGTTMQFTAAKLLEAGFSRVYGLAVVKGRGDSNNV